MTNGDRWIAVCGATGRQGGAVARALLAQGWRVRALTRRPEQEKAQALARLGAEVVTVEMEDLPSLERAFEGVHGVFSVQNGLIAGFDREVVQGRNVADAAKKAGVGSLVYASAGTGETDTGVASWDAKVEVEEHLRRLDLSFTSLRPQALMELMTEKSYYPQVGTWRMWPKLYGEDRPVPWTAVDDVGVIAAAIFDAPNRYAGQSIVLVGDVQSLGECRAIYEEVVGRTPPTFPMPTWLFDRFTRGDITAIWRKASASDVPLDTAATRAIHPTPLTVREWLIKTRDKPHGLAQKGERSAT